MKLAIATLCFRNRLCDEIMETLKYGPKVGFRFIEIAGPITWDAGSIQWMDKAKFGSELEKAGMELAGSFFPPIPTGSEAEALEGAEYANMVADFVAEMKGELIISCGGPRQPGKKGLNNTVKGIERILKHIEDQNYDLQVCFESLDPEAELCGSASGKQICLPGDYKFILENVSSDNLGINLDTGHLYTAGVDIVDFIHDFSDKIFNVHLKDHIGSRSVAVGKGEMNLDSIIRALNDIGYERYLGLELELEDPENAPRYVEESWNSMKELVSAR